MGILKERKTVFKKPSSTTTCRLWSFIRALNSDDIFENPKELSLGMGAVYSFLKA